MILLNPQTHLKTYLTYHLKGLMRFYMTKYFNIYEVIFITRYQIHMVFYRYGTMSSLERFPSDETDDGNVKLTEPEAAVKPYTPGMLI